jgi:hypothetical protein
MFDRARASKRVLEAKKLGVHAAQSHHHPIGLGGVVKPEGREVVGGPKEVGVVSDFPGRQIALARRFNQPCMMSHQSFLAWG